MSIGSEITRIRNAKADIISFLKENGISIPDGISIDDLNYYVEQYIGIPLPSNSISYIFNSAGSITNAFLSTEKVRTHQFSGITTLETVSFIYPNIVAFIGDEAFFNCTNLALTSLPDGITSIGDGAFQYCTNLALTSLPNGLTSIGEGTFSNCTNLALTSLPDGITSIGRYAFYNCTNLVLTSLPDGLISIEDGAFSDCTNLALTSLPDGITSIGNNAFKSCTGLTSIIFKGKPNSINSYAFSNCTNLVDIKVPWSSGKVAGAPWGATNATITYNYRP